MSNLARELDAVHQHTPIEAVMLLPVHGGKGVADDYGAEDIPYYAETPFGRTLTWPVVRPWLDYDYGSSYGTQRCHSLLAWTADTVYFVQEFDGMTRLRAVPRHPEPPPPPPPPPPHLEVPKARWIGPLPRYCDFCGVPLSFSFVDGRVDSGGGYGETWAFMCLPCHHRHGAGLGTGLGQRYALVKGVWQKTAG